MGRVRDSRFEDPFLCLYLDFILLFIANLTEINIHYSNSKLLLSFILYNNARGVNFLGARTCITVQNKPMQ